MMSENKVKEMDMDMMLQVSFLDGHTPIDVEMRPIVHHIWTDGGGHVHEYDATDVLIGWGDRQMVSPPIGIPGTVVAKPPIAYADKVDGVPQATPEQVAHVQSLVNAIYSRDSGDIARACESYRLIVQSIHDQTLAPNIRHLALHPLDVGFDLRLHGYAIQVPSGARSATVPKEDGTTRETIHANSAPELARLLRHRGYNVLEVV